MNRATTISSSTINTRSLPVMGEILCSGLSQFHVPGADQPFGTEIELDPAGNLPRQAIFDQPEAEATPLGLGDLRPAALFPDQLQPLVRRDGPAHMHGAGGVGESTVGRRIAGKLVKSHAQRQGFLGVKMHGWARHLKAGALVLAPGPQS